MSNSKAKKFTTQFSCKIRLLEMQFNGIMNESVELPFFNFDHMNEFEIVKKMNKSAESTFNYPSNTKKIVSFFLY